MFKIKTSDLLQSVGFALTSAKEDTGKVQHEILARTCLIFTELRGPVPKSMQRKWMTEYIEAREREEKLELLEHAFKFADAGGQAEIEIDMETFELLQYNLPSR